MLASEDLSTLLTRSGAGDREAFAEVYDRTSTRSFGLALKVLRDWAQAEEVVQEAYLDIWLKSSRFDSDLGSATSWIHMAVHSRAVNRVRSAQSRLNREGTYARPEAPMCAWSDPTHEVVDEALNGRVLHQALAQLSPKEREVLELAYLGGLTQSEVARSTGVPLGTVKSRTRVGLGHLRVLLDESAN